MNNEERDQALYRHPNSNVLRNKLDIRDHDVLQEAEKRLVAERMVQGVPTGQFDLDHLCAIHGHLFQDVYEWAGQTRQTDIAKTSWFHPHDRIGTGMQDVHRRLMKDDRLRGLSADQFATQSAEYIGDVNRLHPFREGNGRTQFYYLKQLGAQAGHEIDLTRFDKESWIQASIEANSFKCERMAQCIRQGIVTQAHDRSMDDLRRKAEMHMKWRRQSRDRDLDNDHEI